MCQSSSGRSTRKNPGRRRRPERPWRCSSRCSRISRCTRLRLTGLAELAAGERGDHPGAVGRVLPRDPEHRLVGARQRPPLTLRRALRAPVDRLAADPRDAGDERGGAALRDELAGPGDAHAHSQPRKSSPATSTSIVLRPSARSSWRDLAAQLVGLGALGLARSAARRRRPGTARATCAASRRSRARGTAPPSSSGRAATRARARSSAAP